MRDNDWVTHALADTTLVADLLLRMRSSTTKTPAAVEFPPLEWRVRQRRSRYVTRHDPLPSTRASPSTPLSWSSGGGGGGGVECCDEDSTKVKLKELVIARSKLPITCENTTTTTTTTTKRSRKKKTLAELKVEESLLLKEKRQLKNELAFMRIAVEKQIATNQRLKRMKLDLPTQQTGQSVASSKGCSDETQQTNSACGPSTALPTGLARNVGDDVLQTSPSNNPSKVQDIGSNKAAFVLPDLNMPAGEDASSVIFCEVS